MRKSTIGEGNVGLTKTEEGCIIFALSGCLKTTEPCKFLDVLPETVTETMVDRTERPAKSARTFALNQLAILLIVLGIIIGAMGGLTKAATLTRLNAQNVLVQSATRGVASIGQAFVILSGGIDLSVGGIAIATSMIGGDLMPHALSQSLTSGQAEVVLTAGLSAYVAILIMLVLGCGLGSLNGLAISRINLPALIVTLGMWQIGSGIGYQVAEGKSITNLPKAFAYFGQGSIAGFPVPVAIFVGVSVVAYYVLNYTSFGRSVYSVGGNPVSAWLSGISVKRIIFAVYAISGFLAALSGIIGAARLNVASIRTMVNLELDSIAAVSIGGVNIAGGRGSLLGVIIGVIIMGVVNNGLAVLGVGPSVIDVTKGAIIFGAVAAYVVLAKR
jgi:ribose/xylose/arabinose/galactoside ABC-type transport system permease subunit